MSDKTEQEEIPRCSAITAKGTQCRRYATDGDQCASHAFKVPGRPSKLTPKLIAQVVEAVVDGNYRETAAMAVGISKRTLYNWIARGEEHEAAQDIPAGEQLYVEFLHALKSAEAYGEMILLRRASAGGFGWQAPMTVLERKFPDRWGRSEKRYHEHTGKVSLDVTEMDEKQLTERVDLLLARRANDG